MPCVSATLVETETVFFFSFLSILAQPLSSTERISVPRKGIGSSSHLLYENRQEDDAESRAERDPVYGRKLPVFEIYVQEIRDIEDDRQINVVDPHLHGKVFGERNQHFERLQLLLYHPCLPYGISEDDDAEDCRDDDELDVVVIDILYLVLRLSEYQRQHRNGREQEIADVPCDVHVASDEPKHKAQDVE